MKTPGIKAGLDLLIQINLIDIFLALSHMPVPLSMAFRSGYEEMNRHCLARLQKQTTKADHLLLKAVLSAKKLTHMQKRGSQNKYSQKSSPKMSVNIILFFPHQTCKVKVRQIIEVSSRS